MGAQAALTLDRVGLSAAEPLPMAKLAVEDVCHRTMQEARKECERLVGLQRKALAARASKTLGYERPDNNSTHHHHIGGMATTSSTADQGPMPTTISRNGHRKRQRPGGPLASLTGAMGGGGTKRGGVGAMAARFVEQRRHFEAKRERVRHSRDIWCVKASRVRCVVVLAQSNPRKRGGKERSYGSVFLGHVYVHPNSH